MGDDIDFEYISSYTCSEATLAQDCDGDYFLKCLSSKNCPYKHSVRDCDGDWFSVCNK